MAPQVRGVLLCALDRSMHASQQPGYTYLFKNHLGLLAIAFISVFSSSLGQSFFIGLFQVDISESLGITAGQFGTAYASVTLISAGALMYFGPKVDWMSPRVFALAILTGLMLGILLLTTTTVFWLGLLGLGLMRFNGQGMFGHLGNTLAGREFTLARGRALSLVSLGYPSGEIALPLLVTFLLGFMAWQQVWWLLGACWCAMWLLLLTLVPWPVSPIKLSKAERAQGPKPLKDRRFLLLLPLIMALPIISTGLMIYQAHLTADLGAGVSAYALALTGLGVARIFGALFVGPKIDRYGSVITTRLFILPFALALVLAPMIGGSAGLITLMTLSGLVVGFQEPVVNSLLVSIWGSQNLGRVRATLQSAMVLGTAISPVLLGYLIDFGVHFQAIIWGMLAYLCMAWLIAQVVLVELGRESPAD